MLIEQTLLQMVYDRKFDIKELETIAFEDPKIFEKLFDEAFLNSERILFDMNFNETNKNGFSLRQVFSENFFDLPFLEIFKNEKGEKVIVIIFPETKKTKAVEKKQAVSLVKMLNILKPEQIILVLDNFSVDQYLFLYPRKTMTFFLVSELTFNVKHHHYSPILTQATPEELKKLDIKKTHLPRRLETDLLCRYFGFKAGLILFEESKNLSLVHSIVENEKFPLIVVSEKERKEKKMKKK